MFEIIRNQEQEEYFIYNTNKTSDEIHIDKYEQLILRNMKELQYESKNTSNNK